jgi:hypothetical protein
MRSFHGSILIVFKITFFFGKGAKLTYESRFVNYDDFNPKTAYSVAFTP